MVSGIKERVKDFIANGENIQRLIDEDGKPVPFGTLGLPDDYTWSEEDKIYTEKVSAFFIGSVYGDFKYPDNSTPYPLDFAFFVIPLKYGYQVLHVTIGNEKSGFSIYRTVYLVENRKLGDYRTMFLTEPELSEIFRNPKELGEQVLINAHPQFGVEEYPELVWRLEKLLNAIRSGEPVKGTDVLGLDLGVYAYYFDKSLLNK